MFLTGPGVVAKVIGEDVDAAELGGPRVHERNGVCHLVAPTDVDAALLARDLLDYLPQNAERAPAALAGGRPARATRPTASCRPRTARSTTSATSRGRCSTAAACSRSRRAGRATSSARSGASTAARSASSPTSRATSAACSTSTPRRRRRASCAPATCSASRCSCSSTRPGFLPGHQAGEARRDPPRREARLRVRGVHRAARDGRSCARRSAARSSR